VHIIVTMIGIYLYEDRYKIKSRIFTCKYSRVSNWICIMYSIWYLYICKLDHTTYINSRPNTSFQSNWNIDTIKILSSYNCYLANHGYYDVHNNTVPIARGVSSLTDFYETTSVTVIELLTVNDTISVTGNMYVYSDFESCLTILQIK
jgi:hypothetical protein